MRAKVCLECQVLATTGSLAVEGAYRGVRATWNIGSPATEGLLATTGSVAAEGAYRAVRALGRRQPPEAGWDIIGPWGGLGADNEQRCAAHYPAAPWGGLGGAYRAVRAAS